MVSTGKLVPPDLPVVLLDQAVRLALQEHPVQPDPLALPVHPAPRVLRVSTVSMAPLVLLDHLEAQLELRAWVAWALRDQLAQELLEQPE